MKKLFPLIITCLTCLVISAQALAAQSVSDSQKASRQGRDDNGQNCFYSYQITKEGPSAVDQDDNIIYKITVDNLGNCDLRDVDVVDHLSRRVKFIEATPGFILRDDKVIYKDLRIEEGRRVRIFIKVEPRTHHEVEQVVNTASAFAPQVGQRISGTISTTVFRR